MPNHDSTNHGRRRIVRNSFAAMLLAGTALAGYAAGTGAFADPAPATATDSATTSGAIRPTTSQNLIPDFANLVAQVTPAVVSIRTELNVSDAADEDSDGPEGIPGFPGFPGMMPHGRPQRSGTAMALGSGYIVDGNGTIVTNNHVVKDAKSVHVTLSDGTELPAKVIGRDDRTDIAVLRVSAGHPLPFLSLGQSNDIRPGQWVVAVGNPFGLGGSVTAGIVSARGRDIGSGPYDSFIQVDAPINRGNSGGPLITQDGKVVGMNTAIYSPSGGSVGIGFAIPSDTIRTVIAALETSGHVTRGYLGVEAQPVTHAMTAALGLKNPGGALVASVQSDSPASKAGLQPGDVIEAVNGDKIADPRALAVSIAAVKPGSSAALDIQRNGEARNVPVEIASLPGDSANNDSPAEPSSRGIGLALAPISPDVRDQFDLPAGTRGAVVAEVKPGSAAEQAGLQPGDVVLGVGVKSVSSPEEAVAAIRSATSSGHSLALRVLRHGNALFVPVTPPGATDQG
jgi:serine protease Do